MANLYGVANSPGMPINVQIGSAIGCPANTETNILDSGALIAPSQGWFYPIIWINIVFTYTATPPSSVLIGGRIGAGADFYQYGINGNTIVASGTQNMICFLVGPASQTVWQAPGSHLILSVFPQTNSCTVSNFGTAGWFMLYRAPDQ
jgi:hypothetical protein